jgi:hypothetical protein
MNGFQYGNGGYDEHGLPHNGGSGSDNMFAMGQTGMGNGQSLDDIVNLNADAMRRQSMPQQYGGGGQAGYDNSSRQISGMMDFNGTSPAGAMSSYQFDPSLGVDHGGSMPGGQTPVQSVQRQSQSRRQSGEDLALNTNFSSAPQGYNALMGTNSAFTSPAHHSNMLDMGMNSPYIDNSLGNQMDFSMDQSGMVNQTGVDSLPMGMYNQSQYNQAMIQTGLAPPSQPQNTRITSQDPGGGNASAMSTQYGRMSAGAARHPSRSQSMHTVDTLSERPQSNTPSTNVSGGSGRTPSAQPQQNQGNGGFQGQQQYPQPGSTQDRGMHRSGEPFDGINGPVPVTVNVNNHNPNNQGFAWEPRDGNWPSSMTGKSHTQTNSYKGAYSSSGFDMLGVLVRIVFAIASLGKVH